MKLIAVTVMMIVMMNVHVKEIVTVVMTAIVVAMKEKNAHVKEIVIVTMNQCFVY